MQVEMDMFDTNHDIYFMTEIDKIRNSINRQNRAIFARMADIEEMLLSISSKEDK